MIVLKNWWIYIKSKYLETEKKYIIYVTIERKARIIYIEIHKDKKAITAQKFLRNVIEFMPNMKYFKLKTS